MEQAMKITFRSSLRRQRGIASLIAVIFLITAVIFALTQSLNISSTTSIDNNQQMNSTAALFLAESGVENAQSVLRIASMAGTYSYTTCTNLINQSVNLGRGSFTYTAAVSAPPTCPAGSCTTCTVTARGTVGSSSRYIQAVLAPSPANGVAGYGSVFTLYLNSPQSPAYAFTSIALNPQSTWGGDTSIGICSNVSSGTSITSCTQAWSVAGQYYNDTVSQGVFASVPNAGNYSITTSLGSSRNYAAVGIIFRPLSGAVTMDGSYGHQSLSCTSMATCNLTAPRTQAATYYYSATTSPNATAVYSGTFGSQSGNLAIAYAQGYLPTGWTCNANGGTTANWATAANADTLMFGFGGKPYTTGALNMLNAVSLNGQELFRQVFMAGDTVVQNGFITNSQLYYAYNKGYYSSTAGGSSGAIFTGAVGAVVQGCIGSTTSCTGSGSTTPTCSGNGTTLRVCAAPTHGALRKGDLLSGGSLSASTNITAFGTGTGGVGTYTVDVSQSRSNTAITAASNVLRVSAFTASSNTSSGVLSNGDNIITAPFSNHTLSYTSSSVTGGTAGTGTTGDYLLSGALQTVSSGDAQTNQQSNGTSIGVFNASGTAPTPGTALGVPLGTGRFLPDSFTGYISGTTLTVTAPASGNNLSVGDALFGKQIAPNTLITARLTGTGNNGTYTVNKNYSTATTSDTIIDRATVLATPTPTATSFAVSRAPDTGLSGAQLCGGLCPFLLDDGTGNTGRFILSNLLDGDDWSAGFACLRGVDPTSIQNLGQVASKLTGWSDLVQ